MPAPSHVYLAHLNAYQRIVDESLASPGRETGGILVGRMFYITGGPVLVVVAASGPGTNADRRAHTYAPDTYTRQRELEARRAEYAAYQVDYVGEWHKHPPGFRQPSSGDTLQVVEILSDDGYKLPDGIFTPLVTIENGTFMLHGYYYLREIMHPQRVECVVCDTDIRQLLDLLASCEQQERGGAKSGSTPGGRWGVSQVALQAAREAIASDLSRVEVVTSDQLGPGIAIIDMHNYVSTASISPLQPSSLPSPATSAIDAVPLAPPLPGRAERELSDLEQYCATRKASVKCHQGDNGYHRYNVTFAQPFPISPQHIPSERQYQTPEGAVEVTAAAGAPTLAIVAVTIILDEDFPRRPPDVHMALSDGRSLRLNVEHLLPAGWRSHFRVRDVLKSLLDTFQQPRPLSIGDAIEFHGRLIIRQFETIFRSAADICADLNRHYSFEDPGPAERSGPQE